MADPFVSLAYDHSPYYSVPKVVQLPYEVQEDLHVEPGMTVWIAVVGHREKYRVLPPNGDLVLIDSPAFKGEELTTIQRYGTQQKTTAYCKYEPKLDLQRHYKRSWEQKVFVLHPEYKKEFGWKYGTKYEFRKIGDCTLKGKTWIEALDDDIQYVLHTKATYLFPPLFKYLKKGLKHDEANAFRKLPVK